MELFGERITTCETIDQLCDPEDSIEVSRAQRRAGRPGPEIFDQCFSDPEKNFIFNPEPGPENPGPLSSSGGIS